MRNMLQSVHVSVHDLWQHQSPSSRQNSIQLQWSLHGLRRPISLLSPGNLSVHQPEQHARAVPDPGNVERRLLLLLMLLLLLCARARRQGVSRPRPVHPRCSSPADTATPDGILATAGARDGIFPSAVGEPFACTRGGTGYDGRGGTSAYGVRPRCYHDCDHGYQSGRRRILKQDHGQGVSCLILFVHPQHRPH